MEVDHIATEESPATRNETNEKSKAEAPNGSNEQTPADVIAYPNVFRRTAVVVGVALALFTVRRS